MEKTDCEIICGAPTTLVVKEYYNYFEVENGIGLLEESLSVKQS